MLAVGELSILLNNLCCLTMKLRIFCAGRIQADKFCAEPAVELMYFQPFDFDFYARKPLQQVLVLPANKPAQPGPSELCALCDANIHLR